MGEEVNGEVKVNIAQLLSEVPFEQWILLEPATSSRPSARYKHAAEVVQNKLYVVGGSRNGRSLSDVQVFDFGTLKWSALSPTKDQNHLNFDSNNGADQALPALAGHSLVKWKNKLVVVAGNSKIASNKVAVWLIDVEANSWSALDTYGKVPIARGGQSVSIIGSRLIMFGGEDNRRRLLNDLHILDLETMMWEEVATKKAPAPRYDHAAVVYDGQYLLIFGGSSHSTCFSDLHLLDLQSMEWSQPDTRGAIVTPRSGHAGTAVDENWYIVGGGDNTSGSTETIALDISKFVWSVVTNLSPRNPLASEGLAVCSTILDGEKLIVAFGGYNGIYNSEIFVMKPKPRDSVQPRLVQSAAAAAAAASVEAAYAVVNAVDEQPKYVNIVDNSHIKEVQQTGYPKEIDALNEEKRSLESRLTGVRDENSRLKEKLDTVNLSYDELTKELKSVQSQLTAEGSRCQKLELQIAAAQQKLESATSLEHELEVLRRQISLVERNLTTAERKKSGGVWQWVAGSPQVNQDD